MTRLHDNDARKFRKEFRIAMSRTNPLGGPNAPFSPYESGATSARDIRPHDQENCRQPAYCGSAQWGGYVMKETDVLKQLTISFGTPALSRAEPRYNYVENTAKSA